MKGLDDKVVLITGAASGLGAATAVAFIEEGCKVVLTDTQLEKGTSLAEELGDNAFFTPLDVVDVAQWQAAIDATLARFGRLDVLVNNAGGSASPCRIDRVDPEVHNHWVQVNLNGVWNGIRAAVPAMKAQGAGSIINISSIAGITGAGGMSTYTATKFAVTGLTRSAALDLGDLGIRVNSVHPGMTETPGIRGLDAKMIANIDKLVSNQPIKRLGRPEEIAQAVLYFASDISSYCTGSMLVVDGGMTTGRYRELSDDM